MTEADLNEPYATANPNSQFPNLSNYSLFKATTPHPVQAVDVYIKETESNDSSPSHSDGFNPMLATANLAPFDASKANFTPVLNLKAILAKNGGEKLPRVEVFMYPAGTMPAVGVPPVVYIKDLRLIAKGKKLSTTVATLVFAIDAKTYDWEEQEAVSK